MERRWERCRMVVENSMRLGEIEKHAGDKAEHAYPQAGLLAPAGTAERAQIQSWLGYLSFDVHASGYRPFFRPDRYSADTGSHPGIRAQAIEQLLQAFTHVDRHLQNRDYLVGERYIIADIYLGMLASWL